MMEEPKKETFTFITYNLDSSDYNHEERLETFLQYINKQDADIVVVQEGRRFTYEKLGREMGRLNYKYKFLNILREKKTGELIFSRFPIMDYKFVRYTFNAEHEQRGITVAKIIIEGELCYVATTQCHPTPPIQTKQITEIPKILRKVNKERIPIILGGDFQLSSFTKIDEPKDWVDVWYDVGDESTKFTVDYEKNILVPSPIRDRADRIWVFGDLECCDFELIGVDMQPNISSHFGVWAEIKM